MDQSELAVLDANTVVEEAISALAEDPADDHLRIEFYKTLVDKYLALPVSVDSEGNVTAYATKPNFFGEGQYIVGFTSIAELNRSYPNNNYTLLLMGNIFKIITENNVTGLIINYDGESMGVPIEDIKKLFKF